MTAEHIVKMHEARKLADERRMALEDIHAQAWLDAMKAEAAAFKRYWHDSQNEDDVTDSRSAWCEARNALAAIGLPTDAALRRVRGLDS